MSWLEDEIRDRSGSPGFETSRTAIDFNEALIERLGELGWSQSQLASEMGVSRSRISKMLNSDGNVTLRTMVGAALAIGCRLSISITPSESFSMEYLPSGHPASAQIHRATFGEADVNRAQIKFPFRKEGAIGRQRKTSFKPAA